MMRAPSINNQTLLSDDDFVAQFVARGEVLAKLNRFLRTIPEEGLAEHQVLIGPRGMGKTSLLRRVQILIRAELADRFVPLTFREEQYNVLRLGDVWRNCAESLAEWAEAVGDQALADRLDQALLTDQWGDDSAGDQFAAELAALDRRAVLLVDNLDLVLGNLSPQEQWIFRRYLQAPRGPVVVGAATHPLALSADRDNAFYEFFHPHYLHPLSQAETEQCLRTLAIKRGDAGKPVLQVLGSAPARVRTLHRLTGGNPRVLALIYRLLESAETDAAMGDLEALLDQVTPYYKSRIEEYQTAQQRAVIDAIALHWDPVTVGEISKITGVPTTTLSGQLKKLRQDGLIEEVEVSAAAAGHQLVERFLNIWYLMRHGTRRTKQKLSWLVKFLASFYDAPDLATLAHTIRTKPEKCHPDYAYALEAALELRQRAALPGGIVDLTTGLETDDASVNVARALLDQGVQHFRADDYKQALAAWDNLIDQFGNAREAALRAAVAAALIGKGVAYGQMGDLLAAIAAYETAISRIGDAPEAELRELVAATLFSKGVRHEQMGDPLAAIAAYETVVSRFGDAPEAALREEVARALVGKGFTHRQLGDPLAAIAAYETVINRFGDAPEAALRAQVAQALVNKGFAHGQMGDPLAEIAAYETLITWFGDAPEAALREKVAQALVNKGFTHWQMGDPLAAIAAYETLINWFGDAPEAALREEVAWALLNKAFTHGQLGDPLAAIAAYDTVITRFGDAPEAALREQVATALNNKGVAHRQMGDPLAGIAAYETVINWFGDAVEPELTESVSHARNNLANLLTDLEIQSERAEELLTEAAKRGHQLADSNRAYLALSQGHLDKAIALRPAFSDLPPPALHLFDAAVAFAQMNFGTATDHLAEALQHDLQTPVGNFTYDLDRVLRLAERQGFGEALIAWFERTGFADRLAPIFVAFVAYVRGEQVLKDRNPEVREPATVLYRRLSAPRRFREQQQPPPPSPRRRGRPRRTG